MNEKWIGIVAVVGVIVGVLGVVVGARLAFDDVLTIADTDAIGIDRCDAHIGLKGYGAFPERGTRGRLEVFSTSRIWYSWNEDGLSFPVTVEGKVVRCGVQPATWPTHVRYRFDINNGGGNWRPFYQDAVPKAYLERDDVGGGGLSTESLLGAVSFQIDGFSFCKVSTTTGCPSDQVEDFRDGAALRVSVYARAAFTATFESFTLFAQDEVDLRNPLPRELEWETGACKVGTTCELTWVIPVDKDEKGDPAYFLWIGDMNTNTAIAGYDRKALRGTSGRESIAITSSMFSNDLGTCQNRLRATIYSQLVPVGTDDVAVQASKEISGVGEPPRVTNAKFDQADYKEGDTVVVTWTVAGNVSKMHVTIEIAGFILFDRDLAGSVRSASTIAARPGVGSAQITPYDRCQPGEIEEILFTVGNVFPGKCQQYPELAECSGLKILALAIAALAVVAVLGTFVVVFWTTNKLKPLEDTIVPVLAGAGVALLVAGVLVLNGAFDAFLGVI